MDKIQISELSPYLEHDLHFLHKRMDDEPVPLLIMKTLDNEDKDNLDIYFVESDDSPTGNWLSDLIINLMPYEGITNWVKPLLYPITFPFNLTEPIEHQGETVIPLLECAKIAYPDSYFEERGFDLPEFYVKKNEVVSDYYGYVFYWDGDFNLSQWVEDDISYYDSSPVPNQYKLYQKLFELHIDVFYLIDRGMALDVTKTNFNPYK